jgi:GDPmannose 4,6-dehydratase
MTRSTPRRALITGITGQTGSYLAEQLDAAGWEVHGLLRETPPVEPERFTYHQADLGDAASVGLAVAEADPHAIFHLGALTSVAESWKRPVDYARVNGIGTAALLQAAALIQATRPDIAFVNASSSEIFGVPNIKPQTEATAVAPVSPYGSAKAFAHNLVRSYRAAGMNASNCILFNHESPRRPVAFVTRKITSGVADIAAGRADHLTLGNIQARRDWGWAPDYARALALAAGAATADDFVIATGIAHSVEDLIRLAFQSVDIDNWRDYIREDARFMRPSDAPEVLGDASHAHEQLGWTPTVPFAEIISRMVAADLSPSI